MDARLDYYGNPLAAKFAAHINRAGAVVLIQPCQPRRRSW